MRWLLLILVLATTASAGPFGPTLSGGGSGTNSGIALTNYSQITALWSGSPTGSKVLGDSGALTSVGVGDVVTSANNVLTGSNYISGRLNLKGRTDNGTAPAGSVGEILTASGVPASSISLSSGVAANVTTLALSAGCWQVSGIVSFTETGATVTEKAASLSQVTITITSSDPTIAYSGPSNTSVSPISNSLTPLTKVATSSVGITIYLVARASFSAGTVSAFGAISAIRIQ